MPLPKVTVVVPSFQERRTIRDCLSDLCAQDHPDLEILVVDGGSTDGTRDVVSAVAAADSRVRLVDNPARTAAAAMNAGLRAATCEILVRADAHARYARDYVRRSIEILQETDAADVGGPMRPVGTTRFGRAVAAVTSTKVGMGSGAFHWTRRRQYVDTVYLGCYRTDLLRRLGGWDQDRIQWAAEDQELNFRIRLDGGTIVCDPAVRSWYFPRAEIAALWRQYWNYGLCKASTLHKHKRLPTARAAIPAAFVAGAGVGLVAAVLSRRWLPALPALAWAGTVMVTGVRLAQRDPGVAPHHASVALAVCHIAHGAGFHAGVLRIASGRPFDTRPPDHR